MHRFLHTVSLSGGKLDAMEELDVSSTEHDRESNHLD